ncbi:CBASS cGAMP-activated phospholipase [Stenotrophomonas sp. SXG-1]|uniref:CBASS cGAMP-activated phospholipase n=1 Tax=Stenotrophomonas sp. SXG-1 TaxID=2682487 RepID=UPI0017821698|nr:CBASS cGAMP-activated phospholipase [Stenotrophomonas sp. SXG-1]
MSDLDLSLDVVLRAPSSFKVLALSGGGYRGLFAASVLEKIEADYKSKVNQRFELLAGTSIGGIIATALAVGVPAATISRAFVDSGAKIFKKSKISTRWLPGWTGAKYDSAGLEEVIRKILGKHSKVNLRDLHIPLILPTVNVSTGGPCVLLSGGVDPKRAQDLTLLDAALATSAAPTYFPSRKIGGDDIVDGGLIANAPDLVALAEATRMARLDIIEMLSIGTCAGSLARPPGDPIIAGKLGWLVKHQLIELTLSAQESLAIQTIKSFLGSRFLRIDAAPAQDELPHLGLDVATEKSTALLRSMASRAYGIAISSHQQQIADFFR